MFIYDIFVFPYKNNIQIFWIYWNKRYGTCLVLTFWHIFNKKPIKMIGLKKFSGGFFRSVKVKSGKKYQNDRMDMCIGGFI